MIKFKIPGEAKGKGRPRFANRGKFVVAYTDKMTVSYENWVKQCFMVSKQEPLEGELCATIKAYYKIVKSTSKKNAKLMAEGKIRPTKKPDLDNVAKIILDSLNDMAYHDDSQIVKLEVEKFYSVEPYVTVEIRKRL